MNFGMILVIIGCALIVLSVIIKGICKMIEADYDFLGPFVGIGLVLVPIGLLIGFIIQSTT